MQKLQSKDDLLGLCSYESELLLGGDYFGSLEPSQYSHSQTKVSV